MPRFHPNYPGFNNMSIPPDNRQHLAMPQNQVRDIQYNVSFQQNNTDTVRRSRLAPQTRRVTGNVNSMQIVTQPQVTNVGQNATHRNHNSSVFNRNGSVSTASISPSVSSHDTNRTGSSVLRYTEPNTPPGTRRRVTNVPQVRVPETPLQGNMAAIQRNTVTSRAGSTAESNTRSNSISTLPNENNEIAVYNSFTYRIFGSTVNEKIFIFTGTAERVINWYKIFRNHFCYYEVIASVISIQEGSVNTQKIMLLRDRKGPILQVIYYTNTHIDIEDFHVEQVLRCVGTMSAPNILNAVSIRTATQEEIETLQRLCLVCDHAISHFLGV